ncbi:hypothetical protein F4810DRAFT_706981 [Camillea tinctor]|nr:hypothetical protein F4810DRAFT_706981 [Camillea tinctor]
MSGPRLTAPASRLVRSISTSAAAAAPKTTTLFTSNPAPISRKYADLLKERNIDPDVTYTAILPLQHSRHLTTRTSNRPHPPPKKLRLMQTFSTVPAVSSVDASINLMVFPGSAALKNAAKDPFSAVRVPLTPDNFTTHYAPEAAEESVTMPQISIVAANPELVVPSALTEVEGMDADGVELKFVHFGEAQPQSQNMLKDVWKGLNDASSSRSSKPNLAI